MRLAASNDYTCRSSAALASSAAALAATLATAAASEDTSAILDETLASAVIYTQWLNFRVSKAVGKQESRASDWASVSDH